MSNITNERLEIFANIIGAVESGNQVYGKRNYSAYAGAYENSNLEYTCTLGWAQNYGNEGRNLCQRIFNKNATAFRKADTAKIESKLNIDWEKTKWNPSTAEKKALIAIISTSVGKTCQDDLFKELASGYIAFVEKQGVSDTDAILMCANFVHQGGESSCTRILKKTSKPYTLDNIYKACQTDTGNQVGAYKSRQKFVYENLKKYISNSKGGNNVSTSNITPNKVIEVATGEIGYLEKNSNSNLDSKTANAGSNNYTKYWRDMANLGIGNYQGQYWCACFIHWCFYIAFGLAKSQELLLQKFFINCQVMYNLATAKKQIYTTPKVGDIVLFWIKSQNVYGHTGIVTSVSADGKTFSTIEGNTSGGSTVVANGGGVAKKTYTLASLTKPRFVRPNYSATSSTTSNTSTSSTSTFNRTNSGTVVNVSTKLNVRSTPSSANNIIGYLANGNRFDVDGQTSGNWIHIKANDTIGWISKDYAKLDEVKSTTTTATVSTTATKASSEWTGEVTASELNVRSWAGTENSVIKAYPKLYKGNQIRVLSSLKASDGSTWYKIAINNSATKNKDIIGFVSAKYIKKV